MTITYCSTEQMIADLYNKPLQGALFVKFHELIMGRKHIDNLQMGLISTNERVGKMDDVKPIKLLIDYNVDTKVKKVLRNKLYAYIVIHRKKKRHKTRK